MDLNKLQSKIWITEYLTISSSTSNFASSFFPKLYNGNLKGLRLDEQRLTFNEFLFFTRELKQLFLVKSYIFYSNDIEVPYENILANAPMVKYFGFKRTNMFYNFSKTVDELFKIPTFKDLKYLACVGIFESFDIVKLFEHLKKNRTTCASLSFSGQISDQYKENLERIVNEILDAESPRAYIPPFIDFAEQVRHTQSALYNLYLVYRYR
uniref:Uncharacterized protein n=1 Tax=Panagrolaimus davidi TaxID=227884 RepID=A0A914R0X3_9BILA